VERSLSGPKGRYILTQRSALCERSEEITLSPEGAI